MPLCLWEAKSQTKNGALAEGKSAAATSLSFSFLSNTIYNCHC